MIRRFAFIAALALATAAPAAAQTVCPTPCSLNVGQVYSLLADHDGTDTIGYRVYLDGVKVGADLSMNALAAGVVTVSSLVAPARGTHTLQMSAFNEDWDVKSDPLTFTSKKKAPGKPGNARITITAQIVNGQILVRMVEVAEE